MIVKEITLCNKVLYDIVVASVTDDFIPSVKELVASIKATPTGDSRIALIKDFKKRFKLNLDNIIAMGNPSTSRDFIKPYIPYSKDDGYKCYAIAKPTGLVKIHEDAYSSWNCVIDILGNPSNVIIYKKHRNNEQVTFSSDVFKELEQ